LTPRRKRLAELAVTGGNNLSSNKKIVNESEFFPHFLRAFSIILGLVKLTLVKEMVSNFKSKQSLT
jgi:archaellum biogenesis protein FlaJ (TadC family)